MLGIPFGIQTEINRAHFLQMPRRDQDQVLQYLYDKGYSGKEIGGQYNIPAQTVYSRINAHRGRGQQQVAM